jgi:hypothetical protein
MNSSSVIRIVAGLLVLVFYIIRKSKTASTPSKFTQPPPPPPQNFNNPFQQNTPSQNPFQQNVPPANQFPQADNPFMPNPPTIPSNPFQQNQSSQGVDTFFDDNKDAFSQASTRNTNSNMGAGAQSFYCMYCGKKFQSVDALSRDTCFKHPKADMGLQKHVLYRGAGRPNVGF